MKLLKSCVAVALFLLPSCGKVSAQSILEQRISTCVFQFGGTPPASQAPEDFGRFFSQTDLAKCVSQAYRDAGL